MGYILRLCFTAYFVYGLMLGQANAQAAPKINNGKAVVMGGLRGGSLGAASGINYQTGRHGLTADYHQPVRRMPSANDPVHRLPANDPFHRMPAKAKTPVSGVIRGLKNFLKSPLTKTSLPMVVAGWYLGELLETNNMQINDDSLHVVDYTDVPPMSGCWRSMGDGKCYSVSEFASMLKKVYGDNFHYEYSPELLYGKYPQILFGTKGNGLFSPYRTLYLDGNCPPQTIITSKGCAEAITRPAYDHEIDEIDFGDWHPPANVPKPAIEQVYPYILPEDTTIELAPITVTAPQETVTMPDGTVKESNKKETFSVSNPNTAPALVVSTQIITNTYQDGRLTGSETTTTTTDATAATPTEPAPAPEPITDCELVPTLCATQKEQLERDKARDEWLKELPPDEPDLSQLAPREIDDLKKDYQINFGSKICPSALSLQFSSFGKTASFDFTFICDFAVKLRLILLAIAYLIAARILVGALK